MPKGYWTTYSFMGWIDGGYKEFVSYEEYLDILEEYYHDEKS